MIELSEAWRWGKNTFSHLQKARHGHYWLILISISVKWCKCIASHSLADLQGSPERENLYRPDRNDQYQRSQFVVATLS